MTTKKDKLSDNEDWLPATPQVAVTVGESVRIMRELQGLSQNQLASRTGIPQPTISAIESDTLALGIHRAKQLALALHCHPAVLCFPGWDVEQAQAVC